VLWLAAIQGSHTLSRYGETRKRHRATSSLTLGIARDALAQTSLGFHRFEPVIGTVSPLPWAMLLTRQGISLIHVIDSLGIFVRINGGAFLKAFTLHVAMQIGLYLHRSTIGVWRVVSEDSDNFGSGLLVIHGFSDLDDFDQPTRREVSADADQIHALRKLQEIALLGSSQRILFKERNDGLHQIFPSSNTVPIQVLFVVVISLVDIDIANTKELHEQMETVNARRALSHRKLMCHLEAGFVAFSIVSMRLANEVDRKTTFAIYVTSNPTYLYQPFLLIFRS
jgi:hypothetical protein